MKEDRKIENKKESEEVHEVEGGNYGKGVTLLRQKVLALGTGE